jgi:hypothetical protein
MNKNDINLHENSHILRKFASAQPGFMVKRNSKLCVKGSIARRFRYSRGFLAIKAGGVRLASKEMKSLRMS